MQISGLQLRRAADVEGAEGSGSHQGQTDRSHGMQAGRNGKGHEDLGRGLYGGRGDQRLFTGGGCTVIDTAGTSRWCLSAGSATLGEMK